MANSQEILNFHTEIEKIVETTGLSYFDAILHYSEINDIEIEVISKMVTGNLKSKLSSELEQVNLVKKENIRKLPSTT